MSISLYAHNQISAASSEKVCAMLLERCQRAIHEAIASIETSHPEQRFQATSKALEILSFLIVSVDPEDKNDLSLNLMALYTHCIDKLKHVSFKKDIQAGHEILTILEPIQKAYRQKSEQGFSPALDPSKKAGPLAPLI